MQPIRALSFGRLERLWRERSDYLGRREVIWATTILWAKPQDEWAADLAEVPDVIVSTSAIHHLAPAEKRRLFAKCITTLKPGGLFINGDEYRPVDDAAYRGLLEKWSTHMFSALGAGRIPASFRQTLDFWQDRNIHRFGEPKQSGDDCHETIATQVGYLGDAGFDPVDVVWNQELWAVIVAHKLTRTS